MSTAQSREDVEHHAITQLQERVSEAIGVLELVKSSLANKDDVASEESAISGVVTLLGDIHEQIGRLVEVH